MSETIVNISSVIPIAHKPEELGTVLAGLILSAYLLTPRE